MSCHAKGSHMAKFVDHDDQNDTDAKYGSEKDHGGDHGQCRNAQTLRIKPEDCCFQRRCPTAPQSQCSAKASGKRAQKEDGRAHGAINRGFRARASSLYAARYRRG